MILMPLDRGRFVVVQCAPVFNFVRLLPTGDSTKCRSPKNGKKWEFSPPQDDRMNRSRRNFAGNRRPWVSLSLPIMHITSLMSIIVHGIACYSTPNLAFIGKRGSIQEPPKVSKFAQNWGFGPPEADTMNTFS